MARGAAAPRGKRAKPDARREQQKQKQNQQQRPRHSTRVEEDNLFFPRLRRQAKWVFLALAIVFGAGFVFFGVGSGSTGIGDLFRGNFGGLFGGGGSSTSISHLEKEVVKHPTDATLWLKLARAYEAKSRNDDAIAALVRYTTLKPKDGLVYQELAGLYLNRAQDFYNQAQALQSQLASVAGPGFGVSGTSFLAKEFAKSPLYAAIVDQLNKQLSDLQARLQAALRDRENAYKSAVDALPAGDTGLPGAIFSWAQAAELAQDYPTALKAYQRYIKLAPDSALATDARKAVKRIETLLKGQQASPAGAG